MRDKKIGVLLGGTSAEKEISLKSGGAIADALEARGYRVSRIFVDQDIDRVLRQDPIDVAVIALHGTLGEDGAIQGMLETMRIPYTGSGILASALAMDKAKSKELFRLYNIPTPSYYTCSEAEFARLEAIHGSFGFPVFVKPRSAGSSVGAGRASDLNELRERVREALRFDTHALVERFIRGREIAVGVLDDRALGAIEIVPKSSFYDYQAKYAEGGSDYHFPARLSPTRYKGVLTIAERAVRALGVTSASRVDLLVTEDENEYVLEVNTLPGMTPTSLLPKIAAGAGYDFGDLCEAILKRATLGGREVFRAEILGNDERVLDITDGKSHSLPR